MKALLLVAHGSRRESSNDEVRGLTAALEKIAGAGFGDVRCAFLELADPSIPDGIQQCVDSGADEVVVLPYFLSAGRHVVEDIPAEIKKKTDELPDLKITQASYLGQLDGVTELLMQSVST